MSLQKVDYLLLAISGDNDKFVKPFCIKASKALSNKQRSPILSKHLGVVSVSGRRREAIPAASITAFIWMRFL